MKVSLNFSLLTPRLSKFLAFVIFVVAVVFVVVVYGGCFAFLKDRQWLFWSLFIHNSLRKCLERYSLDKTGSPFYKAAPQKRMA